MDSGVLCAMTSGIQQILMWLVANWDILVLLVQTALTQAVA